MNGPGPSGVRRALALLVAFASVGMAGGVCRAEPVRVLHTEGVTHGLLVLRDLGGERLADGDVIQTAQGARVTTRLVFHFADGSLFDESTVFSQNGQFHLISDHLIEKGASFPQPLDMTIETASGQVTVRYTDDHGQAKVESEKMQLPADLANGLVLTLLKNVEAHTVPMSVGYVAATPKPRLVKLKISAGATDTFSTGRQARQAAHYVVKVDIGGLAGLLAPLVGKQPPDSQVWVLEGDAPTFVKAEQSLYTGGPLWRIEMESPVWPRENTTAHR